MKKRVLIVLVIMLVFLGALLVQSCRGLVPVAPPPGSGVEEPANPVEPYLEFIEGFAEVMGAAWRSKGNAILFLDSDVRQNVGMSIDFYEQPYPISETIDNAFFTEQRLRNVLGSTNLTQFGLLCGKKKDKNLRTDIVFWSGNYWEGTKQSFRCGGTEDIEDYEIAGSLDPARSICLVTESTPSMRRDRCLNGPRCDDNRKNGNESDEDCGGSCSGCREGQRCNTNGDCASDFCKDGRCKQPPSCSDNTKNQNETDVDCGGSCKECGNGRQCRSASDCESGNCENGVCRPRRTCNGDFAGASAAVYGVPVLTKDPHPDCRCGHGILLYCANSLDDARGCATSEGYRRVSQLNQYVLQVIEMPGSTLVLLSDSHQGAMLCAKCIWASNYNYNIINWGPLGTEGLVLPSCP